ncbi:gamma-glutamylcyclotransferase [Oceanobacillus massiliensis]|uniref:gamma-glutamylcyclotransferase n=1 Tax=Oceanobacillus massiliensis TaxID=1465765 RepID=UPI0030186D4A
MNKLFVYGTLRKNESNDTYLKDTNCELDQAWVYGELFDTNRGFPVMKESDIQKVYGELYTVTDEQLASIDSLEGYRKDGADNLYERKMVTVHDERGRFCEAITYIAGSSFGDSQENIPTWDWKVYRYLKRETMYYFAYGSCMDNRRFKLANVDQHFNNIIGRGKLTGFGFRFSRSSNDGAKADIVLAAGENVEGFIYEVPVAAVDYLYEREGVFIGLYRPSIVPVSMIDGRQIEVLTFIGIDKSDESKPTEVYADEILTGAKRLLSNTYVEGLSQRIKGLMKS